MPLINVLKKRLTKEESDHCGSSRWAALGLIVSMTVMHIINCRRYQVIGRQWHDAFRRGSGKAVSAMEVAGFNSMRTGYAWISWKTKGGARLAGFRIKIAGTA